MVYKYITAKIFMRMKLNITNNRTWTKVTFTWFSQFKIIWLPTPANKIKLSSYWPKLRNLKTYIGAVQRKLYKKIKGIFQKHWFKLRNLINYFHPFMWFKIRKYITFIILNIYGISIFSYICDAINETRKEIPGLFLSWKCHN